MLCAGIIYVQLVLVHTLNVYSESLLVFYLITPIFLFSYNPLKHNPVFISLLIHMVDTRPREHVRPPHHTSDFFQRFINFSHYQQSSGVKEQGLQITYLNTVSFRKVQHIFSAESWKIIACISCPVCSLYTLTAQCARTVTQALDTSAIKRLASASHASYCVTPFHISCCHRIPLRNCLLFVCLVAQ